MLLVGAVAEVVGIIMPQGNEDLIRNLQVLQKQLKYGLQSTSAITLCEMGFADRVVAIELSSILNIDVSDRGIMAREVRRNEQEFRAALEKYPQYFTRIMDEIL